MDPDDRQLQASSADDAARIEGYLGGERAVFHELDRWIRTELLHRYPGLRAEQEDLCQTVHGRLLVNLQAGRFESRSTLRTYVTGIVHHTAIDRIRELRRRRELLTSFAREPRGSGAKSPRLERAERIRLLHRAMLSVPRSCRELWKLVFIDKLGYDEIGRRLDIPAGTVKSRMWHCRRKAAAALTRLERSGERPGARLNHSSRSSTAVSEDVGD